MPNLEDIKRRAQNAAYAATEKAQEAAAAAGEKAGALKDYAGEKAGAIKGAAQANVSLAAEKRNLEKGYQALGEWYAAQCGDDAPEAVADIVKAIRASQEKIAEIKAIRGDRELSARELVDKGVEFFAEKAEAIAAIAKKRAEGEQGHKLVDEGVEAFAERAEALAEEAKKPADGVSPRELVNEGIETFAERAETAAAAAAKPSEGAPAHELVDEGVKAAADFLSGGESK